MNEKTGETENLSTDLSQNIPIPLYNSETGRR